MSRKMTRRKVYIPMPPRGLRPKLAADQVADLDLCHLQNLDAIATGDADEATLWSYAGGVLTWGRVAESLGLGVDEMAVELEVVGSVLDRFERTGRIGFSGTEYQRAKDGIEVMSQLARVVDRPTAILAAEYSEARLQVLAERRRAVA